MKKALPENIRYLYRPVTCLSAGATESSLPAALSAFVVPGIQEKPSGEVYEKSDDTMHIR